ncbi:MAG TPA: bifunctional UDP-N-acetylglucosamine diphosphorylase/glucosamine-1-phosphate N-acetyltransferase GlmU [Candidatus Micrarchaeia archaeon]|nr:bifunctional UDP-N-acetylglucosamine diphosphorylase/glucosamine-1-phosphate N-acetyltransferase GlmU [Candidatus Micrarchaeia archaeon]
MAARVVILAAGRSTRMRSAVPKVLHPVAGRPLIDWVLDAAAGVTAEPPVVVVAPGSDALQRHLAGRAALTIQPHPRGTADAALCARPLCPGSAPLVVLYADAPLLRPGTVRQLVDRYTAAGAAAAVLTARAADPSGYGRVRRGPGGDFQSIVEERDLPRDGESHPAAPGGTEVNAGVYVFDPTVLWPVLVRLRPANAQGELYLSEAPALMGAVTTWELRDPEEMLGVNDRVQLAAAATVIRRRLLEALMRGGVTVEDPATTWVDAGVEVGTDTVLRPGTVLGGRTRVGRDCVLGPFAQLEDTEVGDRCRIAAAHLSGCRLGDGVAVGPFNRVRPGSVLEGGSRLGTFTELARTTLGPDTAVPHLTYLGDATIGGDVNVGAGTITANWDGLAKHPTVVGDGARLGSDTILVAPVTVGAGAYTGAGSVVTKDVPAGALGLARARQRNLLGWVARRRGRRRRPTGDNGEGPPRAGSERPAGGELG